MNYWIRVIWEWIVFFIWYNREITTKEKKKLIAPGYEHKSYYTCLFSNLDMNLHMNNSVYLTVLEFARSRYGMECGINQYALKKGYGFVIAGNSLQYRREVGLFQTVETRTKIAGIEDKWMYFEQTCYVKGRFVARGIARMAIFDPKTKKTVSIPMIIKELFLEDPEYAEQLLQALSMEKSESNPRVKTFIEHQESIKESAL